MTNKVTRILILSDFFLFFAFGLLSPIFAVFVLDNISGSSLSVIGMAATFYWIARVTLVVPFSRFMDKIKGERDEFFSMLAGTFFMSIIPLFYLISSAPWHIYLIQFLMGAANSLAVPAWRILFTNHVSKRRVGYEWSLEDVAVGVATATSATVGALIAERMGFHFLFGMIAIIGVSGSAVLLLLQKDKKIFSKFIEEENRRAKAPLKVDGIK